MEVYETVPTLLACMNSMINDHEYIPTVLHQSEIPMCRYLSFCRGPSCEETLCVLVARVLTVKNPL